MGFRRAFCSILFFSLSLFGCSDDTAEEASTRDQRDGFGLGGARGELTEVPCESSSDCDDGLFCTGKEVCEDGFCRRGVATECDDGIACTIDTCSPVEDGCSFKAPDADGDGHGDISCRGANDELLGDDCDDADPNRYPGNREVCSGDPLHDEDCDPATYGYLDADLDGVVSATCCNEDSTGEMTCGADCDDFERRRFPDHPEICDDIDNDCDGKVDVNTREVPWYVDADDDYFGDPASDVELSCAPLEGRALRSTDCDDGTAAVHPAALEVC
ncbi:MAG: hypothetical protein MK135_03580, partial [Polyangiaceae bacterium]|nr:hypothetical protein [Polyangiaceae bacterium]